MAHGESHSPRSWFITHRTSRCSTLLYAQAGAVGDCASQNDGVSAGIEASSAAALTSLEEIGAGSQVMSWLREGVRILWRQGVPMEPFVHPGRRRFHSTSRTWGGWMGSCAGRWHRREPNRRCHMFGLRGAGLRGGAVFGRAQSGSGRTSTSSTKKP